MVFPQSQKNLFLFGILDLSYWNCCSRSLCSKFTKKVLITMGSRRSMSGFHSTLPQFCDFFTCSYWWFVEVLIEKVPLYASRSLLACLLPRRRFLIFWCLRGNLWCWCSSGMRISLIFLWCRSCTTRVTLLLSFEPRDVLPWGVFAFTMLFLEVLLPSFRSVPPSLWSVWLFLWSVLSGSSLS